MISQTWWMAPAASPPTVVGPDASAATLLPRGITADRATSAPAPSVSASGFRRLFLRTRERMYLFPFLGIGVAVLPRRSSVDNGVLRDARFGSQNVHRAIA